VGTSEVGAVEEEGEGMAAVGTTMAVVQDRDKGTDITTTATTTAGISMTGVVVLYCPCLPVVRV
jgi:hypothetical protein